MKPIIALFLFAFNVTYSPAIDSLELKSAVNHPMQYFISLPEHWTKERQWPVVVIVESANKEYRENALRFVRARKEMPFILIAPFNVNNSRQGRRDPAIFPYSSTTWDFIEKTGDCKFNMDGISQIIMDIHQQYNGEEKYYITGFEAGAHTVWQFLFQHPEKLKAAAPVAGNYNQNSCMTESLFSGNASGKQIPVMGFSGSSDSFCQPGAIGYLQWKNAKEDGIKHGFNNITEKIIQGKGHVPLPDEVLHWFFELSEKEKQ